MPKNYVIQFLHGPHSNPFKTLAQMGGIIMNAHAKSLETAPFKLLTWPFWYLSITW